MSAEHMLSHALLDSIQRTTPGGIRREQFTHTHHPIKTAVAMAPFAAFIALAIFAAVTR